LAPASAGEHMHVGICHIALRIPENHSLKGKRQVLKSVIARLQNRYNVSVAEVDSNDAWQAAGIGVCCVSNSPEYVRQLLESVVDHIESSRPDVEVVDYEIDVIRAL
jgi:uncharacterized protein YlxP (DUF503 family)